MKFFKVLSVFLCMLALSACVRNTNFQQNADLASEREIRQRAVADLQCESEQLTAKRIAGAVTGKLFFGAPNGTWLVEGCGKRGVYQVMCQCQEAGWSAGCADDPAKFSCNPMLESTQSLSQMQHSAAVAANVSAQEAARRAAAAAHQQQMQQQQRQWQAQRQQFDSAVNSINSVNGIGSGYKPF